MSFEAFATGVAKGLNQNFKQKRKAEQQWRQTKINNFVENTVPQYRKDKRKANEIRTRAQDGVKFLQNRKGLSEERARNVAFAYADKYDNMVDYRKALASDIKGPTEQQTADAVANSEASFPESDPISAYDNVDNTQANRDAMLFDMAETTPEWRQAVSNRQQQQQQPTQSQQQTQSQSVPQSQDDGPSFLEETLLGKPDYGQASDEAYQRISQMTGYSPGMVKLMDMGKAVQEAPSGSLAGVEMTTETDNDQFSTMETNVQNAWGDSNFPDEGRQAYREYQETGNTDKLLQAARLVPESSGDSDSYSDMGLAVARTLSQYQQENPQATAQTLVDEGIITGAQMQAYNDLRSSMSLEDYFLRQRGGGLGGSGPISPSLDETLDDGGNTSSPGDEGNKGANEEEDPTPEDNIPLSALGQGDIEEKAEEIRDGLRANNPDDPAKWVAKKLKKEGYTEEAISAIIDEYNS